MCLAPGSFMAERGQKGLNCGGQRRDRRANLMLPCLPGVNRIVIRRKSMAKRGLAARCLSRLLRLFGSGAATLALCHPANAAGLAPPPFSIIHAGHLLAAPGKPPLDRATLVVAGGK